MSFIHPDDSKLDHTLDPPPLPIHEQEGRTWNVWTYTHWWIHTLETLGRWLFHMNCLFLMIIVLLSVAHRTTFWASFEKKKKKKCRKIEDPPLFFSYLHLRESLHSFYICLFSFDPVSLSLYLFFRLAPTLCGGPWSLSLHPLASLCQCVVCVLCVGF